MYNYCKSVIQTYGRREALRFYNTRNLISLMGITINPHEY